MSETSSNKTSIFEKLVPALLIITVGLSFLVGTLWQKVENLSKGVTPTTAQQPAAQPKVELSQIKDLFSKDLIKFGNADSKVLFVEASDPSCPYCHVAGGLNPALNKQIDESSQRVQFTLVKDGGTYVAPVPEIKKLVEEGKASFVWLYFNGHGNGELATQALYCAYEKGKFWEAHDLMMTEKGYDFINNTVKNDMTQSGKMADFLKSANIADLKSCIDSGKYKDRLSSDMSLASSLGVSGTPGFFINDTNFAGAYSYKDMESIVTSALK